MNWLYDEFDTRVLIERGLSRDDAWERDEESLEHVIRVKEVSTIGSSSQQGPSASDRGSRLLTRMARTS